MGTEHYALISFLWVSAGQSSREQAAQKEVFTSFAGFFDFVDWYTPDHNPGQLCYFGRKKHYTEPEMLDLINRIPWQFPETVQVFVKSEHDDKYTELVFPVPAGYQPGSTWAHSGDVAYIEALKGDNANT